MPVRPVKLLAQVAGGIVEAIRAQPTAFWMVVLGVLMLGLILPLVVLSVARGPFNHLTFKLVGASRAGQRRAEIAGA